MAAEVSRKGVGDALSGVQANGKPDLRAEFEEVSGWPVRSDSGKKAAEWKADSEPY